MLLFISLFFCETLQGHRTSARASTATVFVIKASIRDQSDGSVCLQTQHLMKLDSERDAGTTGLVSVSVYCSADGMNGGKTPTPKSRCKT